MTPVLVITLVISPFEGRLDVSKVGTLQNRNTSSVLQISTETTIPSILTPGCDVPRQAVAAGQMRGHAAGRRSTVDVSLVLGRVDARRGRGRGQNRRGGGRRDGMARVEIHRLGGRRYGHHVAERWLEEQLLGSTGGNRGGAPDRMQLGWDHRREKFFWKGKGDL